MPSRYATQYKSDYHSSDDISEELDTDGVEYYQEVIGILRWAIEIGQVGILVEVSLLSEYLTNPRKSNLDQSYDILSYSQHSSKIIIHLDQTEPNVSEN